MKIKSSKINTRKKTVEIQTNQNESFALPFVKLPKPPTSGNPIARISVDRELGRRAVTLVYASGHEESVHLDAFLEYNRDPSYLRDLALHDLTIKAREYLEQSGLSKHEVIRRMNTSPSQLYRLLDPARTTKSIDEMLRLLSVLGCKVEWKIGQPKAA